jgi:hypothetical protein
MAHIDTRAAPRDVRRPVTWWWFLVPLVTLGLGTAPMVFYGAYRLRSRAHRLAAAAYLLATAAFCAGVQFTDEQRVGPLDAVLLFLVLLTWLGGVAQVAVLQSRVRAGAGAEPVVDAAVAAAQRRAERRRQARRLVTEQPELAAELHIGRVDLAGREYDDGGLVDVNHVPVEALAESLALTTSQAEQIDAARTRCGGLVTAEELLVYCDDVTPNLLATVRDRLLFVPL